LLINFNVPFIKIKFTEVHGHAMFNEGEKDHRFTQEGMVAQQIEELYQVGHILLIPASDVF
jgi:hypothetical protein